MKKQVLLIWLLLCSLPLAGCATAITQTDLLHKMEEKAPLLIVDVRSRAEYDRDHIPGAVHIPFYSIASGIKTSGYSGHEPIVLYCEHGPRAGLAGMALILRGYDRVFSLEGHMKGWREKGFPREIPRGTGASDPGSLPDKHPVR
jgi:rhodanese-related sulfurtransferase